MVKMSKKSIPITSMGDLLELVNHNCEVLDRRTKKLVKSSHKLKVLCIAAIGYAIYTAIMSQKQEEQIYQLSVRVKKLECGEGE